MLNRIFRIQFAQPVESENLFLATFGMRGLQSKMVKCEWRVN